MEVGYLEELREGLQPKVCAVLEDLVLMGGVLPSGDVITVLVRPPGQVLGTADIDEHQPDVDPPWAIWEITPGRFVAGVAGRTTSQLDAVEASTPCATRSGTTTPQGWWAVLIDTDSPRGFPEVVLRSADGARTRLG